MLSYSSWALEDRQDEEMGGIPGRGAACISVWWEASTESKHGFIKVHGDSEIGCSQIKESKGVK